MDRNSVSAPLSPAGALGMFCGTIVGSVICSNDQTRRERADEQGRTVRPHATETSLSRADADDAVVALFSTTDDALGSGETDRTAGFGTVSMRPRPTHPGRNPRVRARASPSTPRRRLPSRPARPSAKPPTSGFGGSDYRCRTLPMCKGINGRGKSSGSVSAPLARRRSPENAIRRPVRRRHNQIATAFVANVADTSRRISCAQPHKQTLTQPHADVSRRTRGHASISEIRIPSYGSIARRYAPAEAETFRSVYGYGRLPTLTQCATTRTRDVSHMSWRLRSRSFIGEPTCCATRTLPLRVQHASKLSAAALIRTCASQPYSEMRVDLAYSRRRSSLAAW